MMIACKVCGKEVERIKECKATCAECKRAYMREYGKKYAKRFALARKKYKLTHPYLSVRKPHQGRHNTSNLKQRLAPKKTYESNN